MDSIGLVRYYYFLVKDGPWQRDHKEARYGYHVDDFPRMI